MFTRVTLFICTLCAVFSLSATTITVTHQAGQTTLDTKPKKVVVIGIGSLDALDSFGIEPIAVTKTNLPSYLEKYKSDDYASSGSLFEPDFEKIYSQKPDLIIVGVRSIKSFAELSKIAPTVVFAADNKQYWQSTQKLWRMVGEIFEIQSKVEQKIGQLETEIQQISKHNIKGNLDALTLISSGGNVTAFGANSRFASIYNVFGFTESVKGIKESRHGDLVSFEFINKANPSNLFIVDRDSLINPGKSTTSSLFDNALVKTTKAFETEHIVYLDLNAWYIAIGGVTAMEQMIEDIKSIQQ